MTKTVAEQIIEVIECIAQKFGITIDWSAQNLLPVAEHLGSRVVNWCTVQSIFWIIFCALFVIAGIVGFKKCIKWVPNAFDDDEDIACVILIVLSIVLSIGAIIVCGIGFFIYIFELVKCLTFPELAILEYIQSFIQ